ncbi:MAG: TatD family hydrolase [Anaerolineae bacterium]
MLIDTHCHLDFERYDADRDAVVERALAAEVERIIIPAIDLDNCPTVLHLAEQYEGVFAAVGVHPNSSAGWRNEWVDALRDLARHDKVVAIGEIGLDYYRDHAPKTVQRLALAAQLALAAELDLPVIIHNRNASEDVLHLLSDSPLNGRPQPGVLHSFSAEWATAQSALKMGFYLGFTGPVTFKKADELRRIVAKAPADRLLVETDGPFLAPHPYRGKRNEPAYVALIAGKIAAVRGVTAADIAAQTSENALQLFWNTSDE